MSTELCNRLHQSCNNLITHPRSYFSQHLKAIRTGSDMDCSTEAFKAVNHRRECENFTVLTNWQTYQRTSQSEN